jgi:thiol-disulfide isomerase/thioredoxin
VINVTMFIVSISMIFYVSYAALWLLTVTLSVLVFLVYRHFGLQAMGTFAGVQRDGLALGEEAPPVRGVTADSQTVSWLPGRRGPGLLLFVAPECQPCAAVLPYVDQLNRVAADGRTLEIVAIAAGPAEVAQRLREIYEPSFVALAENESRIFDDYGVRVTPFAFVIDDGRVRAKGLCSDAVLLRNLLAEGNQDHAADLVERFIKDGVDATRGSGNGRLIERRAT